MTTDGQHQPMTRTLADLRHTSGLTQAQVAERMGVTANRVNQIEATYPHVRYDTLLRYMDAIGGGIQFIVGRTRILADQLVADPAQQNTRDYLRSRSGRGGSVVYVPSSEELPLQDRTAQPGGDHPGRDENEPDTQGDQSDSGNRQQP